MRIRRRPELISPGELPSHLHPVVQQVLCRRDFSSPAELEYSLDKLLPPDAMQDLEAACQRLISALQTQERVLVVGDFDADGATSCALLVSALREMGLANVSYLVPDRFKYGYGLTPEIVEVGREYSPNLIITVDNGIASIDGVAAANALGIDVLVTDHHLPGSELPAAVAILNPNNRGCEFPSKALCGCGVVFYLLIALRKALQAQGWFEQRGIAVPNLAKYLDLVALATVADVVPLDYNNRILVQHGLERIRSGYCRPGITALVNLANRRPESLTSTDLGFAVGPRLNAAGRLQDMSLGIECLLADDYPTAMRMARELDQLNRDRREIEADMQQSALAMLDDLELDAESLPPGLCLSNDEWHSGVVGLLASRIKDRYHRPVVAFARDDNGVLKGSGRSIPGFHMRDALDRIATENPGLVSRFGGHAMAAGLSLEPDNFADFQQAFEKLAAEWLAEHDFAGEIATDGELDSTLLNLDAAEALVEAGPWGQLFPVPLFDGRFSVVSSRIVGEQHLKLVLRPLAGESLADESIEAMSFYHDDEIPAKGDEMRAAFQLEVNEYMGRRTPQLIVRAVISTNSTS